MFKLQIPKFKITNSKGGNPKRKFQNLKFQIPKKIQILNKKLISIIINNWIMRIATYN
jgi:hypothetical protein